MSDYSQLSDQQILAQLKGGTQSPSSNKYSQLSDAEIMQKLGGNQEQFPQFPSEKPFEQSPATPSQRMAVSFPHTPEGKALAAAHVGLEPVGFNNDGKLLIRNQKTGEAVPIRPNGSFFQDWAGRLAEFVPEAIRMAGMVGGDTLAGPAGGVAGAMGAEAVNQGIANQLSGEAGSAGRLAGEGIGAGAGYALFGAGKMALKGAAGLIGKNVLKLGPAAEEVGQELLGIDKTRTRWLYNELKGGKAPSELFGEKFQNPDTPLNLTKRIFFGGDEAEPTLKNFVDTYKKNLHTSNNPSVIDEHYTSTFGNMDQATLDQMKHRPTTDLLDPTKTNGRSMINFAHTVQENIADGYKGVQEHYGNVLKDVMAEKGGYNIPTSGLVENALSGMAERGMVNKVGKQWIFDPEFSNTKVLNTYKNVLNRFGVVGEGPGGKNMVFKINEATKASEISAQLKKMEHLISSAVDPNHGFMNAREAAPLTGFIKDLKAGLGGIDERIAQANKDYSIFMNGKEFFDGTLQRGTTGEQNMIKALRDAAVQPTAKVDASGRAMATSTRDAIEAMDKYMPSGKKILPRLDELNASQNLMLQSENLLKDKERFTPILAHSLGGNQSKAQLDSEVLNSLDSALPKGSKFLYDAQRHLVNVDYGKPGSLFKSRWLGFLMGSVFGSASNPLIKARNIGMGIMAARPATWANSILPATAALESQGLSGLAQNASKTQGAKLLGALLKQISAQGGAAVGRAVSS